MRKVRMNARVTWVMGILASVTLFTPPLPSHAAPRAVAIEGDVAPGTGGVTFDFFDEPMVNVRGDIVFNAEYGGFSGRGVFLKLGLLIPFPFRGLGLIPIAVTGRVVPGVGTLSDEVDGPIFNNNSTVGFVYRNISGGPSSAAVFQKKLLGFLTVIAKQGDPAPGTSGVFDTFDDMSENDLDDLAFIATYTEDGGTTFKTGVFLKINGGPIIPIVLNGDSLPGGGTQCGTHREAIDGPWVDNGRAVAFIADSICGGTVDSGSAFIKRSGMPIEALVLKGAPAPPAFGGTIEDVAIGRPGLQGIFTHVVGFKAELSGDGPCSNGDRCGVFTKALGASPVACVLGGAPAPGTIGTFDDFDAPASNKSGRLSIEASVIDDPVVTKGIFACKAGVVTPIALRGDPKPGTASTFGSDISDASLSDSGLVTFIDTTSPGGVFVGP